MFRSNVICLVVALLATVASAEPMRVASHNVHYIVPNSADNDWPNRRDAVVSVIADINADIIAFQEMETWVGGSFNPRSEQLEWVLLHHPQYQAGAFANAAEFPITQPILYKASRFQLLDQGFFFFSETPNKIYSRQWNGRYPYFATWVKLLDQANHEAFFVLNAHNDFASRSNRIKTSKLIVEQLEEINSAGHPLIIVGDFNAFKGFRELRIIEDAQVSLVEPEGGTHRLFGWLPIPAIDHFFVSKRWQTLSEINVWKNRYEGTLPSDHFPISIDLELTTP